MLLKVSIWSIVSIVGHGKSDPDVPYYINQIQARFISSPSVSCSPFSSL